ncbi:MAG: stage II sporulation protein R [Clostridia bacterium]|nr:stage II sporulation protein R [Clostridia bacterium]
MKNTKLLTVALAICSLLLFVGLFPVHGEAQIYESVVRLHVLANSDSEEDQSLKLEVRDAVLEYTAPLLSDCPDRETAIAILKEQEEDLVRVAEARLRELGAENTVTVTLGEEEYPARSYDGICFPAGKYVSLQIKIGEAEGKNWWCCLFPALCFGGASVGDDEAEEAFVEVGLTPSQYKIITETERPVYRIRFKLLELLRGLWE